MCGVRRDVFVLKTEEHDTIERVETSLNLIFLLIGPAVAQFYNKRQHLVVFCIVEGEFGGLEELVVQVDEHLHRHLIDLQVSLFATALLVHHPDKVPEPVEFLFLLFIGIVKPFHPLITNATQRTVERPDGILDLLHIEQIFGNILLS